MIRTALRLLYRRAAPTQSPTMAANRKAGVRDQDTAGTATTMGDHCWRRRSCQLRIGTPMELAPVDAQPRASAL